MRSTTRISAVLFDLDDTVYDHRHATLAALRAVASAEPALLRHGLATLLERHTHALEAFHPRVVAGQLTYEQARIERYRDLLTGVGAEADLAQRMAAIHAEAYRRSERLTTGVARVLDALRRRGFRLGIVSNSTRTEQSGKLTRLGVANYFEALIVSGDHGLAKPDPRLFHRAADTLGVDPVEAAFIGDKWEVDVLGAKAAGMHAIWYCQGAQDAPDSDVPVLRNWRVGAALQALCARRGAPRGGGRPGVRR